jgi:23S rRNA (pseudouridine1915-N3)-methyltransferase
MLSIKIFQVGKTKDTDLQRMILDFYKRISTHVRIEEKTFKTEDQMIQSLPKSGFFIALEVLGKQMSSEAVAELIETKKNQGISSLVFLIGPPDGFSQKIPRVDLELSLSAMTFSHQTVRLMLAEQIYRVTSILEGTPFSKH